MTNSANSFDVVIAGAGPAGSSAAIHLAQQNFNVLLVEQKSFPRAKLCGEFISPECTAHFDKLGVAEEMMSASPALVRETVFYSRKGQRVTIPSGWFGTGAALGLSRAVMDQNLLERAKQLGVQVIENATVLDLLEDRGIVRGVRVKVNGQEFCKTAHLTIDATGRGRVLTRRLSALTRKKSHKVKARFVAFKAHLENTRAETGACEIYFYPGGYGGLSSIEGSASNLCFIVSSDEVRRLHSDPEVVVRETVMKNCRAAQTLAEAKVSCEWLSVSLESFGPQSPSPARGLLAVGDSAAFIDPFTGSGMLMALESGELVAKVLSQCDRTSRSDEWLTELSIKYARAHRTKFNRRLRTSGLLRHAAFRPRLAEMAIAVCSATEWLPNRIAQATRASRPFSKSAKLN